MYSCSACFKNFHSSHWHPSTDFTSRSQSERCKDLGLLPGTDVWIDKRTGRRWYLSKSLGGKYSTFNRPMPLMKGWTWWKDSSNNDFFVNQEKGYAVRKDPLHIPSAAWTADHGVHRDWSKSATRDIYWYKNTSSLLTDTRPANHPCLNEFPLPHGWYLKHTGSVERGPLFHTVSHKQKWSTRCDPRAERVQWLPISLPGNYLVLESDIGICRFSNQSHSNGELRNLPPQSLPGLSVAHVPFGTPIFPPVKTTELSPQAAAQLAESLQAPKSTQRPRTSRNQTFPPEKAVRPFSFIEQFPPAKKPSRRLTKLPIMNSSQNLRRSTATLDVPSRHSSPSRGLWFGSKSSKSTPEAPERPMTPNKDSRAGVSVGLPRFNFGTRNNPRISTVEATESPPKRVSGSSNESSGSQSSGSSVYASYATCPATTITVPEMTGALHSRDKSNITVVSRQAWV